MAHAVKPTNRGRAMNMYRVGPYSLLLLVKASSAGRPIKVNPNSHRLSLPPEVCTMNKISRRTVKAVLELGMLQQLGDVDRAGMRTLALTDKGQVYLSHYHGAHFGVHEWRP